MSNDRHDYESHEDRDDFGGERRHRGPRGPHEHRGHHNGPRGRRPQGDSPWEQIFGADGPFGPRGPFGKGGLFGPQGADMARAIWENATAGAAHPQDASAPPRDWERGPRGRRDWAEDGEFGRPDGDRGKRRGGPDGPRGEGRGRRGHGGPGGRRGRRPKGDVRLAALLLIAEEPRNGYQIIEELASRSSGAWKPSSGAVYPALAQLEDEGLIEAFDNDGRKAFRLTDAGQQAVEDNAAPAPWETATADASEAMGGRPGGEMWQAFGQVAMAAKAVSATRDAATMTEAAKVLEDTRRALYRILADGPQDEPVDAEIVDDES